MNEWMYEFIFMLKFYQMMLSLSLHKFNASWTELYYYFYNHKNNTSSKIKGTSLKSPVTTQYIQVSMMKVECNRDQYVYCLDTRLLTLRFTDSIGTLKIYLKWSD